MTLVGVVLSVMSAANTWANLPPKTTSMVAATYVATYQRNAYLTSGYGLMVGPISVGWLVVFAALAVGALLLYQPTSQQRSRFFYVQMAVGLLILALAIRYLSLYAGVIMALVGAAALLVGAVLRYSREPQP
jgi:predicted membrane channel-forming protein YqfA (hemolysin III family)